MWKVVCDLSMICPPQDSLFPAGDIVLDDSSQVGVTRSLEPLKVVPVPCPNLSLCFLSLSCGVKQPWIEPSQSVS